jgi:hypothetical protein
MKQPTLGLTPPPGSAPSFRPIAAGLTYRKRYCLSVSNAVPSVHAKSNSGNEKNARDLRRPELSSKSDRETAEVFAPRAGCGTLALILTLGIRSICVADSNRSPSQYRAMLSLPRAHTAEGTPLNQVRSPRPRTADSALRFRRRCVPHAHFASDLPARCFVDTACSNATCVVDRNGFVACFNAVLHTVPLALVLFGHRSSKSNLTRLHVDDTSSRLGIWSGN